METEAVTAARSARLMVRLRAMLGGSSAVGWVELFRETHQPRILELMASS
jgi:hypothetical protein